MIGQTQNLAILETWKSLDYFPRLIVISGEKGSGKSLMAQTIAKKFGAYYIPCDLSVETVRETVENCYKCNGTTVYAFLNADKMSAQAKSALLKITEEPPRSAHFILTVQDTQTVIDTILSRAAILNMQPYTLKDLQEYMGDKVNEKILNIASTPGDIDELQKLNVDEFYSFCEKVFDNIGAVSGVNAFKIAQNLKFKEDDTGYDPILFLKCILTICMRRGWGANSNIKMIVGIVHHTVECLQELQMPGLKKDSTVDMWILKVREVISNATD
jgi:nicotinamide riboside kinase